jgi:small-conductance mechanosensitive channel
MIAGLPTSAELISDLVIVAYKLVIFLIILAIGWVIGRLVGALVGRIVSRTGGDSLMRHTVIGRTLQRSDYNSFKLARLITRWVIYIAAFVVALEIVSLPIPSYPIPMLASSVSAFISYLPRIIGCILIFFIGITLSDWVGEFVKKSSTPEKRELFYLNVLGDVVKIILYFVTITLALSFLGVDVTILYIIAQAFAWGVAILVGVAAGVVIGWLLKDRVKEWLGGYSK